MITYRFFLAVLLVAVHLFVLATTELTILDQLGLNALVAFMVIRWSREELKLY